MGQMPLQNRSGKDVHSFLYRLKGHQEIKKVYDGEMR